MIKTSNKAKQKQQQQQTLKLKTKKFPDGCKNQAEKISSNGQIMISGTISMSYKDFWESKYYHYDSHRNRMYLL